MTWRAQRRSVVFGDLDYDRLPNGDRVLRETLADALTAFGLVAYSAPAPEPVTEDDIKNKRIAVLSNTFPYLGKSSQCDTASRLSIAEKIATATQVTDEQWAASFPGWRCADNSLLPLTRAEMIGMGLARDTFDAQVWAVFYAKLAALPNVNLNDGWPE